MRGSEEANKMTKQSWGLRNLKRQARNAGEELEDVMEEMREFAGDYAKELSPLEEQAASLVSAMERYNQASQQRQKALEARAASRGIMPYAGIRDMYAEIKKFRKRMLAREAPVEPQAMETPIQPQPDAGFYGGRFYVAGSNAHPVVIYQIVNTPMNLELKAGALYA